jgi:hypothetical protein
VPDTENQHDEHGVKVEQVERKHAILRPWAAHQSNEHQDRGDGVTDEGEADCA